MLGLFLNAVRLAVGAILRNKARSLLTVLGILIGIASVVTMMSLVQGATAKIGGEIDGFASNALFINPQPTQSSGARSKATGRLTENDGRAIAREAVSVTNVAPWLSTFGQVVYQERNVNTALIGTTTTYFPIRKFKIGRGELWTESDELLKTKVCVIGQTVATNLFGTEDPVGRTIRIGRSPYRIIGLLEARGSSTFGEDQDDRIMMPIGSFRARVQATSPGRADMLMASASSEHTVDRAQEQITAILRQRHRITTGRDSDFTITTQREMQEKSQAIADMLFRLLVGVAAISLLVGGVGVMNIMLVTVAERTREIGIRMSIGAREGDILTQFLVEAIALTMVGGLLGIILGVGATFGVGRALGWTVSPSPSSLLIAVGTSVAIGVIFGFMPARRAAKMDPIDALRVD